MVKFVWLRTILLRRLRSAQVKKEEQWAEDDQWRQERLNHRQQKLGKPEGSKMWDHVANWWFKHDF